MPLIEESKLHSKQKESPIRILHLSSLIDSKGYPEYLEAITLLPNQLPTVNAILCGRFTGSQFSERFTTEDQASKWIDQQIAHVHQHSLHSLRWIKGSWNKEKERLFHDTHIFVFPSRYHAEAQPLVLLEAMASGCAIITTQVGEINTILSDSETIFIHDTTPKNLAREITRLILSPEERLKLATSAQSRFIKDFSPVRYQEKWQKVLEHY